MTEPNLLLVILRYRPESESLEDGVVESQIGRQAFKQNPVAIENHPSNRSHPSLL
jgi:hypothetical protein